MKNKLKTALFIIVGMLVFTQCNNDENDYYAEPDWLEAPLYEVLQAEGRFSLYLACLDRTLYAAQIKEGGYFTIMAPNDDAFHAYLTSKNYSSVNDIPAEEANKIIAYSILKSYWLSENLGDFFTGTVGDRYVLGGGVKRQTYYYETIYRDPDYDNNWVIDQNTTSTSYNQSSDVNFKYLPVFMNSYFSKLQLSAYDYNMFFPNTEYAGNKSVTAGVVGNVYDGAIIKPNMKARNGIAHEVSTVNYPLDNMDKFLMKDEYKEFKTLLDFKNLSGTYLYKHYADDASLASKYSALYPDLNINKVYVKSYSNTTFSPALEKIYIENELSTETSGYTLFVPSNEALSEYLENRILKHYSSLKELPTEIITTLINTHMANGLIWPSLFKSSQVSTGEYTNGLGQLGEAFDDFGVIGKTMASNGFIYNIDRVIKSKYFETVFSEMYLNPNYKFVKVGFANYYNLSHRENLMKSAISGFPNNRYTMLMISDDLLKEDGFIYDELNNKFENTSAVGTTVAVRLQRLMLSHLFEGWVDSSNNVNSEIDFSEGGINDYGGWGFRNTMYGDVIRYKDNQLQASGNVEDGTFVTITKGETFDNGTVYSIDKMLQYSNRESSPGTNKGWNNNTLWYYIQQTGQENANVSDFVKYVEVALKDVNTDALTGINEENFYTIIMPNNNAFSRARQNGDLQPLDSLTDGVLRNQHVEQAANFLKSHFLTGAALPDDRLSYLFPYNVNSPNKSIMTTMYKINIESMKLINQSTSISVSKDATNRLSFTPEKIYKDGVLLVDAAFGMTTPAPRVMTGKVSTGNNGYRSNRIAGRCIHHEYTNYFKFEIQQNP